MLSNNLTANVRLVSDFPQHTALLYQRPGLLDISSFKTFIQASFFGYITNQENTTQKKKTSPGEIPGKRFLSTYILNIIHIWITKVLQKSSDRKEQWSEYK